MSYFPIILANQVSRHALETCVLALGLCFAVCVALCGRLSRVPERGLSIIPRVDGDCCEVCVYGGLRGSQRLAPIQVTSYGHPVSTYNSSIDYWLGELSAGLRLLCDTAHAG